jgi:hypothetical protein
MSISYQDNDKNNQLVILDKTSYINDEKRIECYNCFNDMNYDHYIFCNGKCYWCWECSETQYININGSTTVGHHPDCKNETIK